MMERVPGVTVTVHVGKIQDKSQDFYEEFQLYILGLDSIEARRYMNGVACSFLGTASLHSTAFAASGVHTAHALTLHWEPANSYIP